MKQQFKYLIALVIILVILTALYQSNFLVFHIITEGFSFMIGVIVLLFISLSIKKTESQFLKIVGYGVFLSGSILFLHMLSYVGMDVFYNTTYNESTQYWVISNLVLSISFFLAMIFLNKKVNAFKIGLYMFVFAVILVATVIIGVFPD